MMVEHQLHILLVEDSKIQAFTLQKVLEKHMSDAHIVTHVDNMADALKLLRTEKTFDLILLDLGLPDTDGGKDTFHRIHDACKDIPIIIVTSKSNHDLSVGLVDEGAEDYVRKEKIVSDPERICDAIDFSICRHKHLVEDKQEKEAAIKEKDAMMEWMNGGYSVR